MAKKKKKDKVSKFIDDIKEKLKFDDVFKLFNIEVSDVPKIISYIAVALLIKQGIEWSEDIVTKFPTIFWLYVDPQDLEKYMDSPQVEVIQWIYSFGLAYIFVENAGSIIAGGLNVISWARAMLPI